MLVVVFLDADSTYFECATTCGRCVAVIERLLISSPIALYEIEGCKSQDGLFLEACHEDTHEANACEVANVTLLAFIFLQGNTEEIPCAVLGIAITEFHAGHAFVGNVVAADYHIFWTNADFVLIVLLVFVEGVVLVDVLHIGRYLPSRLVAFWPCVGVGTVALWHVDALVAVQDGCAELVEVGSAIVVVVVVGRVGIDAVID